MFCDSYNPPIFDLSYIGNFTNYARPSFPHHFIIPVSFCFSILPDSLLFSTAKSRHGEAEAKPGPAPLILSPVFSRSTIRDTLPAFLPLNFSLLPCVTFLYYAFMRQTKLMLLLGCIIIAGVCFLAYSPAIKGPFLWDDNKYVVNNPLLSVPDGLWRIWFSTDVPSQYFPLVYTTLRFEHQMWGLNQIPYHIDNIALHVISALLLWLILRRLAVPAAAQEALDLATAAGASDLAGFIRKELESYEKQLK
jgi:hypothetical protein